jgi:hypothetical protein
MARRFRRDAERQFNAVPIVLAKMLSGANVFETLKPVAFKKMKLKPRQLVPQDVTMVALV